MPEPVPSLAADLRHIPYLLRAVRFEALAERLASALRALLDNPYSLGVIQHAELVLKEYQESHDE